MACMTLVTGMTATVATGAFTSGITAVIFSMEQAKATVMDTANYSVYDSYGYDIVQWTGGTNADKPGGICYGYWYLATYKDGGLTVSSTVSNTRDSWEECITSGDCNTLMLDAASIVPATGELFYDISGVQFSGIIVTADCTASKLASNAGNRSIYIGPSGSQVGYTTIARDFTLSNALDNTNTSPFQLRGSQVWNVLKDVTYTLETRPDHSISQTDGAITVDGGGTVVFANALTMAGTFTLNAGSTLSLNHAITNNGTLVLNGTVNLTAAMESPDSPSTNGFVRGVKYTFATGNVATVGEDVAWKLDGVAISGIYSDNALHVSGSSTLYSIVEENSSVSTLSIDGETGYLITGKNSTLKLDNISSISDLADGISMDTGADTAATVALSGSAKLNANEITRTSGILNISVGQGAELTLSTNTDSPNINGDLTITAGGKVISTAQDSLGYDTNSTKNLYMSGEAGNEAIMDAAQRITMSTNVIMGGNARINNTTPADASTAAGFDTFGGNITATGTNNLIGINIYERNALTIDVTGAADELEISGRVLHSPSGGTGNITKTGNGTLTLSYKGDGNHEFHGTLTVEGGELVVTGDSELYKTAKVYAGATLTHSGTLSISSLTSFSMIGTTTYSDATGTTATDGYRTGQFVIIEAKAGATINGINSVQLGNESLSTITDTATGSLVVQSVDYSTYWVFSEGHVYDSNKFKQGSAVIIEDGASLRIQTTGNQISSLHLADAATLIVATGGSTTWADVSGAANNTGTGKIIIDGNTTFNVTDNKFNNFELYVAKDSTLSASGCFLAGDITVQGTLNLSQNDAIDYNATNTIKLDGGTMALGATRQSFNANHKLILNNATITGTGDGNGALDFFQNGATVVSTETSTIDAPIRLRTGGHSTTFDVQDGTLTISGNVIASGKLVKSGEGELVLSGEHSASGGITVNGGKMSITSNYDPRGEITLNSGELVISGTCKTASGTNNNVTINSGVLTLTGQGSLTSGTKYINSGGTLRAMAGTTVRSTVQVNTGGTFEFGTTGCGFAGITLKLNNDSTIKILMDKTSGESGDTVKILELATDANRVFVDTGDIELTEGKAYKLLTYSSLTNVTADKFSLVDTSLGGRYDTVFALDTGHKALTLSLAAKENALFWTGENTDENQWDTIDTNTPWETADGTAAAFTTGAVANFDSTVTEAERTVKLSGTIEAEAAYVNGTGWEFTGAGALSTTGILQVGGIDESSLTISSTGNKTFGGGVVVDDGSILKVTNGTGWTGTVSGAGTLEIATGEVFSNSTITKYMNATAASSALGTLVLSNGTAIHTGSSSTIKEATDYIGTIKVEDGSYIATSAPIIDSESVTLSIAGNGLASPTNDYEKAALTLGDEFSSTNGFTLECKLNLHDDATVYVGSLKAPTAYITATISGDFSGNGHTLTKTGSGALLLNAKTVDAKLNITAGTIAFKTSGTTDITGATKLSGGASLMLFATDTTAKMKVADLNVEGEGSVGLLQSDSCFCGTVELGKLSGTAGSTLTLRVGSKYVGASIFDLVGNGTDVDAAQAFEGTIQLYGNVTGDSDQGRWLSMVISDGSMTTGSILDVAENAEGRHRFGIGINDAEVTVAGLQSQVTNGGNVWIYSGAAACKAQSFESDSTARTLTINTAESTAYSTNATVLSNVNINKTGKGSQAFVGDMSGFEGAVTVTEGTLSVNDATENAPALKTTQVSVAAGASAEFADGIQVNNSLSSAGTLTTTGISGAGSVSITAGTVTLSNTTDAFANTGTTSISGADLAGTWTADGISIGKATIVSGAVTLQNSTISGQLDSVSGSLILGGNITLDQSGFTEGVDKQGTTTYSQGTSGFATAAYEVQVIKTPGNVSELSGATWKDKDGISGTYDAATGVLTVKAATEGARFYINGTDAIMYDDASDIFTNVSGTAATALVLNGGSLELTTNLAQSLQDGEGIVAEYAGASNVKLAQDVTLSKDDVLATTDKTIVLSGDGIYDAGNTPSLGTGVSVGTAWTGTVSVAEQNLGTGTDLALGAELYSTGSAGSTVKIGSINARNLTSTTGDMGLLDVDGTLALSGTSSQVNGNLTTSGATTLASDSAVAAMTVTGDMTSNGIILGSDSKSATLTVDGALTTPSITLASAASTIQAGSIICPSTLATTPSPGTLNIKASDAVLNDLGVAASQGAVTLITLTAANAATPTVTVNGKDVAGGFGEYGSKYFFTITWNEKLLQAVGTINNNYVNEKIDTTDQNAAAGAELLNDIFVSYDPQQDPDMKDSDWTKLLDEVDNGNMTDEHMAAVAGSSTAALGMAFAGDVERQLRAIRNRTTTMGVNQCVVNEGMPYFNAWVLRVLNPLRT